MSIWVIAGQSYPAESSSIRMASPSYGKMLFAIMLLLRPVSQ
jgi:hypothetical protein